MYPLPPPPTRTYGGGWLALTGRLGGLSVALGLIMRLVLGSWDVATLEELAREAVGTMANAILNRSLRGQTIPQVMGPYSQRRKISQMTVVRSMYSVVSRYHVSDFWLLSRVVTRLLLLLSRELKSVYFSPRSARAAVDCSSVSCANLERDSSLCINC